MALSLEHAVQLPRLTFEFSLEVSMEPSFLLLKTSITWTMTKFIASMKYTITCFIHSFNASEGLVKRALEDAQGATIEQGISLPLFLKDSDLKIL